jgi:hypothetical protein
MKKENKAYVDLIVGSHYSIKFKPESRLKNSISLLEKIAINNDGSVSLFLTREAGYFDESRWVETSCISEISKLNY